MSFQSGDFPVSYLQVLGSLRNIPVSRMYLLLKQLVVNGQPVTLKGFYLRTMKSLSTLVL